MNDLKVDYTEKASGIEAEYYSFTRYNSKIRMLTYWHQITEVLEVAPDSVLEIGKGSGLVSSYLKTKSTVIETLDINEDLSPDHVGNVENLVEIFGHESWDVVLCSRVLHHIPPEKFYEIVNQLVSVARKRVVLSVPVDDLRLYAIFRITSGGFHTVSLGLPNIAKVFISKILRKSYGSGLWQLNSTNQTSVSSVLETFKNKGLKMRHYRMAEDKSHMFFVIDK